MFDEREVCDVDASSSSHTSDQASERSKSSDSSFSSHFHSSVSSCDDILEDFSHDSTAHFSNAKVSSAFDSPPRGTAFKAHDQPLFISRGVCTSPQLARLVLSEKGSWNATGVGRVEPDRTDVQVDALSNGRGSLNSNERKRCRSHSCASILRRVRRMSQAKDVCVESDTYARLHKSGSPTGDLSSDCAYVDWRAKVLAKIEEVVSLLGKGRNGNIEPQFCLVKCLITDVAAEHMSSSKLDARSSMMTKSSCLCASEMCVGDVSAHNKAPQRYRRATDVTRSRAMDKGLSKRVGDSSLSDRRIPYLGESSVPLCRTFLSNMIVLYSQMETHLLSEVAQLQNEVEHRFCDPSERMTLLRKELQNCTRLYRKMRSLQDSVQSYILPGCAIEKLEGVVGGGGGGGGIAAQNTTASLPDSSCTGHTGHADIASHATAALCDFVSRWKSALVSKHTRLKERLESAVAELLIYREDSALGLSEVPSAHNICTPCRLSSMDDIVAQYKGMLESMAMHFGCEVRSVDASSITLVDVKRGETTRITLSPSSLSTAADRMSSEDGKEANANTRRATYDPATAHVSSVPISESETRGVENEQSCTGKSMHVDGTVKSSPPLLSSSSSWSPQGNLLGRTEHDDCSCANEHKSSDLVSAPATNSAEDATQAMDEKAKPHSQACVDPSSMCGTSAKPSRSDCLKCTCDEAVLPRSDCAECKDGPLGSDVVTAHPVESSSHQHCDTSCVGHDDDANDDESQAPNDGEQNTISEEETVATQTPARMSFFQSNNLWDDDEVDE